MPLRILLEASPADLVAEDGNVTVAGTDRSITFGEIARAVYSGCGAAAAGSARRTRRDQDL